MHDEGPSVEREWLIPPGVLDEVQSAWANEPGAEDLKSGRHIDHYRLSRILGSGGMGVVWEALDLKHDRAVALKFIDEPTPALIGRFARERHILAQLNHPYIATLYDSGYLEDGSPYLVMEYVKGEVVDQYGHRRDLAARLRLFQKICEAVQAAHQGSVSHRDIKPTNILVAESGIPKLLDFGIAGEGEMKLDEGRPGPMTRDYASPEQAGCYPLITTQTDIYSLGVLLYTLVAGRQPYHIPDEAPLEEIRSIICARNPDPPSAVSAAALPRRQAKELDWIVLRAMHKEPAQRYPSAAHLAGDIASYFANEPVWAVLKAREEAGASAAGYRARKFVRRHMVALSVLAAFTVTLSTLTWIALLQANEARKQATEAQRQTRIAVQQSALARSRELAARAGEQLTSDPAQSLLLAAEAVRVERTPQARQALEQGLLRSYLRGILRNDTGPVRGVVFSPDSQRLATWGLTGPLIRSRDEKARIWEVVTGKRLYELKGVGVVDGAIFSPNGRLLVTVEFGWAFLWDLETGKEIDRHQFAWGFLRGPTFRAVFDSKGARLLAAGAYGAAIWDLSRRTAMQLVRDKWMLDANFSYDGRLAFTLSGDGKVMVWDAESVKLLKILEWNERGPFVPEFGAEDNRLARFSPDNRLIVVSGKDGTVRVWNGLRQIAFLHAHAGRVTSVAFAPDGSRFVTSGEDGGIKIWDTATQTLVHELRGHTSRVNMAEFSRDGHRVISAGDDGVARIWDAQTGHAIAELSGHRDRVLTAAISPDGRWAVTGSGDATARLWDLAPLDSLVRLEGHKGPILNLDISADGEWVVTAGDDGTARLWETRTGKPIWVIQASPADRALTSDGQRSLNAAFSSDGKWIVTAGGDRNPVLWGTQNGKPVAAFHGDRGEILSLAVSPDSRRIATREEESVRIWDVATGHVLHRLRHHFSEVSTGGTRTLSEVMLLFSPIAGQLVSADLDAMRVWQVESGVQRWSSIERTQWTAAPVFSPDGKQILGVAGNEGIIWDAETGKKLRKLSGYAMYRSASFSPKGDLVSLCDGKGTTRVWRASTGELLSQFQGQKAAFSPDGEWVATDSGIWETRTGRLVVRLYHTDDVKKVVFLRDGKTVVTASLGEVGVYTCSVCASTDELLARATALVDSLFTRAEQKAILASNYLIYRPALVRSSAIPGAPEFTPAEIYGQQQPPKGRRR